MGAAKAVDSQSQIHSRNRVSDPAGRAAARILDDERLSAMREVVEAVAVEVSALRDAEEMFTSVYVDGTLSEASLSAAQRRLFAVVLEAIGERLEGD